VRWAARSCCASKIPTRRGRTDASLQIILAGLRWLGIDWDEGPEKGGDFGPYFQMQRLELYAAAAQRLLAEGKAYPCYCTTEEIEAGREALKAQKSGFYGYNGRCRNLTAAARGVRAAGAQAERALPHAGSARDARARPDPR
jgi:glutamyl/glutaminyl-tRNA synthetase